MLDPWPVSQKLTLTTTDFQCARCGGCCRLPGQIHLTEADITRLAGFLGLTEHEFIQCHTDLARDRRDLVLQGDPATPCRFLQGNDCIVYPARPEQCAGYPEKWNNPRWENVCQTSASTASLPTISHSSLQCAG